MMRNEKMCRRKRLYWSEGMARGVALRVAERRGVSLRTYRCPYCYQWHLTKQVAR